jgi:hypothetical protein
MKRIYCIQYDLLQPGRDYQPLIAAIKQLGSSWAKPLESCFAIVTTMTSVQIRDSLATHLDTNDKLLVTQIGSDWASRNLLKEVSDWFKQNVG